jgi:Saxitoxin biosynthesis operon protein SxtJ
MTRNTDAAQLRNFGLLVGGIFCAIGLWPAVIRGAGPRSWALVVGVLLLVPALLAPRLLAPVHRIWMTAGEALGWINTRILLGVVFYGLITPMGLIRRLRREDPMRRRHDPAAQSYRVPKPPRPGAHMNRQF